MEPDHPLDDAAVRARIAAAAQHPCQVVATVRHLLDVAPRRLPALSRNGRKEMMDALAAIVPGEWPELPLAPVVRGQRGFVLKPATLHSLRIVDCHDFVLDLDALTKTYAPVDRPKFAITIRKCSNFTVRGGRFVNARNICIVDSCETFAITRLAGIRAEGYGVIVFNSKTFEISECVHTAGLASGLYCLGNTSNGWIHDNIYADGIGHFNWDAGLHINHCSAELTFEQIPEHSHEDKRIVEKVLKPARLHIENNLVARNRAQGIYCEGTILCTFEANTLIDNNKEGICLDWGSALNVFRRNTVTGNGERAKLTETEVKADFIEHFPLLADGSSSCKLPGVSIDNGALNFIIRNRIFRNFGGGVKMVRTGIGNIVFDNMILDNDLGRNTYFPRYNGVYQLAMGAGDTEFNPATAKLDFYPSMHNVTYRNTFSVDARDKTVAHDAKSSDNLELHSVNVLEPPAPPPAPAA
jgi:parallel beta-helix repeat protein